MSTTKAVSDPIGNNTWSLVIKTMTIDCIRESLGTISGKGSIQRGDFVAQFPPK